MNAKLENTAFSLLGAAPFVVAGLVAAKPLRAGGIHPFVGFAAFAVITASVFVLARDGFRSEERRDMSAAGVLFIMPYALFSLLWVGMATPWDATPGENVMRYEVLAASTIAVTLGFFFVYRVLRDLGERSFSTLMLGLSFLAGAAYLIWNCFQTGYWLVRVNTGGFTPAAVEMNQILDVQLFFATLLTYIATAAAVISITKAKLLSRWAAYTYLALSAVAVTLLLLRGISFPDPNAGAAPWYETPGFVVGIPAMPWVMPFLLGLVLLRRSSVTSHDIA